MHQPEPQKEHPAANPAFAPYGRVEDEFRMPVDATGPCKEKTRFLQGRMSSVESWAGAGWREISLLQRDDLGVVVRDEAGA